MRLSRRASKTRTRSRTASRYAKFVIFDVTSNNSTMTRPQFFILGSVVIFLLERALPTLTSWPIFIFPIFVILFLLVSKNDADELVYVAIAVLIFDFFSGYTFGFLALAILAVALAIFFFKTRFNVNSQSFFSLAIYTFIFAFVYLALLSIRSNPRLIITQIPTIVTETTILFLIFNFAFRRVKNKTTS